MKEDAGASPPKIPSPTNPDQQDPNFVSALDAMLDQYASQLTAQAERLISFALVLFAVVQVAQYSKSASFSEALPNVSTFFSKFGFPSTVLEWWKFAFLFGLMWILTVFILRTIFRYGVYGYLLSYARSIDPKDAISELNKNGAMTFHAVINRLAAKKARKGRIFFCPRRWFLSECIQDEILGWIVCFLLGFVLAFGVLLILW